MEDVKPPQNAAAEGRAAYRRSLELNQSRTPSHGRRIKPISAERLRSLAFLYDQDLQKNNPSR